jgi:hypothetical protein
MRYTCLTHVLISHSQYTTIRLKVHSKSAYPVGDLQKSIIDSAQDKPANPSRKVQKAYSIYLFQPYACLPSYQWSVKPYYARTTWIVVQLFRLFLLMVGNPLCLVMLCLISARRDKPCPQYRVRNWSNTNHFQPSQKLYDPLENSCMTFQYLFQGKMIRFYTRYFTCKSTHRGCFQSCLCHATQTGKGSFHMFILFKRPPLLTNLFRNKPTHHLTWARFQDCLCHATQTSKGPFICSSFSRDHLY